MLPGIVFAVLLVVVLVLAMAESALSYASRAKLEDVLDDFEVRRRYFRYLNRSGPARSFCVAIRVLALISLAALLVVQAESEGNIFTVQMVLGLLAAILAELMGRVIGKSWSTPVLIVLLPALQIPWYIVMPFRLFTDGKQETGSPERDEQVVDAALEEIRVAIEDAATEGAIEADEKDMIEGVLEFEDVEVHEIMTPRTEIECLEVNSPAEQVVLQVAEFHHSRIPVFEDVRDKIVGVLHVKDLLPVAAKNEKSGETVRDLVRKPFFVPETNRAMSLLRDFKQRHLQIAIILDEYGGVTGLVTLEDVMEQIVGELEEGFEAEKIEERVRPLGPGKVDVDGRLRVDDVNDMFNIDLPEDEDYDTIGGFVMARLASVPQQGEELRYNGVLLRVLECDERRVHRLLLERPGQDHEES
ncbi:MAG: hemolysin family protein [Candidatus Brocadiia bacterium]